MPGRFKNLSEYRIVGTIGCRKHGESEYRTVALSLSLSLSIYIYVCVCDTVGAKLLCKAKY